MTPNGQLVATMATKTSSRERTMDSVADLTLVLAAALAGGFVAQRLRQQLLIVGYIIAGVVVGPFTGGFTVAHVEGSSSSPSSAWRSCCFRLVSKCPSGSWRPSAASPSPATTIQLLLTIAFGVGLAAALGWAWQPALWFGALIPLSSTMVALKTLQAQGRLGTLSSRVMLGMLVVQDLAVVPLDDCPAGAEQPGGRRHADRAGDRTGAAHRSASPCWWPRASCRA